MQLGRLDGSIVDPATLASVLDPTRSTLDDVGILGAPTHLFVDAAGVVVDLFLGPIPPDELDARLSALLGGAEPGPAALAPERVDGS